MKRLDELGISPAPWRIGEEDCDGIVEDILDSGFGDESISGLVVYDGCMDKADASLIAAAPKLYEALREALKSYCEGCNDFVNEDQRCDPCECPARKWRAVLAEAAGDGGEA